MKTINLVDTCMDCRYLQVASTTGTIEPETKKPSLFHRAIREIARGMVSACSIVAGYMGQDDSWAMDVNSFSDGQTRNGGSK